MSEGTAASAGTAAGASPAPPMRVALLAPRTQPEVHGGVAAVVRTLAAGLIAGGHHPRLITSHPGRPGTTVEAGLVVRRNWRPPAGRLERRGYDADLSHIPASRISLQRGGADLAHAFHCADAAAAASWSSRTHRPALFSCMELADREWLVARRGRLARTIRAVDGCAAVVVPSRFAADTLISSLGVCARVIQPGVDLLGFTPGGARSESPTILCPASAEHVAGLVRALPHIRRVRTTAKLILPRSGDPGLAAHLAGCVGVELTDDGPRRASAPYRRAWLTALPLGREAFTPAGLESLACGTPVVGWHDGPTRELIDRAQIGRLLSSDEPAAVAQVILEGLELADDPRTASACRRRAEELPSEHGVNAYERLYRELLASPGAIGA